MKLLPSVRGLAVLLFAAAALPASALNLTRLGPCQVGLEGASAAEDLDFRSSGDQIFWLSNNTVTSTTQPLTADDQTVLSNLRAQCAAATTNLLLRTVRVPTHTSRTTTRWVIADINNDGLLDSILANANGVIVQMGQPNHLLAAPVTLTLGPSSHIYNTAAVADVNGDGKPDLILCCTATAPNSKLAVALGNGDGTFQASRDSIPGANGFAIADWNGDGRPDVVTLTNDPALTLALGQADGTFLPLDSGLLSSSGLPAVSSVVIADITGDGRPDAIVLFPSTVTVFPSAATGKFATSVGTNLSLNYAQSLVAADFNGDGKLDLAVTQQFGMTEMLTNNDAGRFLSTGTFVSGQFARGFAVDLNDDGIAELLLPSTSGAGAEIVIVNSAGRPVANPVYGIPPNGNILPDYTPLRSAIAVADFNGDKKDDIALIASTQNSSTLMVFSGANSLANLTSSTPIVLQPITGQRVFIQALAALDFDGDQRPDLVALEGQSQSLWLFHNNPLTGFDPPTVIPLNAIPQALAIADFNRDRRIDVAVALGPATPGAGQIKVFYNTGSGLALGQTINLPNTPYRIAPGDFNGDFNTDIAYIPLAPAGNVPAGVVLGQNDSTFLPAKPLPLKPYSSIGSNPSLDSIQVADVNGDGSADILVGAPFTGGEGPLAVFLGDGKANFQALPTDRAAAPAIANMLLTDLDNDGKLDLVTAHCCGATTTRYQYGRADGTFTRPHLLQTGSYADQLVLADLNGDGTTELVARSYSGASVTPLIVGGQVTVSSSASGIGPTLAADSLASAYGAKLSQLTASAATVNQFDIAGTRVSLIDSTGQVTDAPLSFAAPGQVNFLIPSTVAAGNATVVVQPQVLGLPNPPVFGDIVVTGVVPGLFVVDPTRLIAANIVRVNATGQQIAELPYAIVNGALQAVPLDLGPAGETVVLVLYGTGIRNRASLSQVKVTIGAVSVDPFFAGAQTQFPGLDQINFTVPRSLIGRGSVDITVSVAGQASNAGRIVIQ